MRHVYNSVEFQEVVDALSPADWDVVVELAMLLNEPVRDVVDVAVQQCNGVTSKEEWQRIYEDEILPLEALLPSTPIN